VKRSDSPCSLVSGAAGPRSLAEITFGDTEPAITARLLLEIAAVMRSGMAFWAEAAGDEAPIPARAIKNAATERSREEEVARI